MSPAASATVAVNASTTAVSGVCGSAERHNVVVQTFDPPFGTAGHSIVRGGVRNHGRGGVAVGPTAARLRPARRRELTLNLVVWVADPVTTPALSRKMPLQLGSTAIFCDTFDKKNPGYRAAPVTLTPTSGECRALLKTLILVRAVQWLGGNY